ncbi:hypothetical protein Pfo_031161 [Paulownia fortunei]|nr:hypothetical protein Pfo_031161 [Paulownia fortunei]
MIFLCHHLHEKLKIEYLTVKDPYVIWKNLKEIEYNSTMFKITSQLKLCGERRGFKKYSELISCLLVLEQNTELLMKNHQSLPTGSTSFPEVNAAVVNNFGRSRYQGSGRGGGYSRGRGRGYENGLQNKNPKTNESNCHRCSMKGYWRRICRRFKHLINLYQASLKEKGKGVQTNLIEPYTPMDFTQLDVADFFENPNENFENLNDDGNINMV